MGFKELYLRWRYSPAILRLWRSLRPGPDAMLKGQEHYYENLLKGLKPGDHIAFDIGANEGFVSAALLKKGLRVIAVEPDHRNLRILAARFDRHPKFRLIACAAGSEEGSGELYLQREGTALSTMNPKWKELVEREDFRIRSGYETMAAVAVTTLDELIREFGVPCFLKIDVEGYEAAVLTGLSRQVPFLVFEANLPEFTEETAACLERLYQLDPAVVFNYSSSFQLRLDHGIPYHAFREMLPRISDRCIDVICMMSNFRDCYDC